MLFADACFDTRVRKCHTRGWLLNRAETNIAEQFSPPWTNFAVLLGLIIGKMGNASGIAPCLLQMKNHDKRRPIASSCGVLGRWGAHSTLLQRSSKPMPSRADFSVAATCLRLLQHLVWRRIGLSCS